MAKYRENHGRCERFVDRRTWHFEEFRGQRAQPPSESLTCMVGHQLFDFDPIPALNWCQPGSRSLCTKLLKLKPSQKVLKLKILVEVVDDLLRLASPRRAYIELIEHASSPSPLTESRTCCQYPRLAETERTRLPIRRAVPSMLEGNVRTGRVVLRERSVRPIGLFANGNVLRAKP